MGLTSLFGHSAQQRPRNKTFDGSLRHSPADGLALADAHERARSRIGFHEAPVTHHRSRRNRTRHSSRRRSEKASGIKAVSFGNVEGDSQIMPIYSYNTKSGDKLYRVSYRDPNHIQRTKRGFGGEKTHRIIWLA